MQKVRNQGVESKRTGLNKSTDSNSEPVLDTNPRLKPRLRSDWSAVRSECFQVHLDFCSYPHLNNSSCRDYKSATKELLCGDQESSGTSQQTTRRINMFEAYRGPKLTGVKSQRQKHLFQNQPVTEEEADFSPLSATPSEYHILNRHLQDPEAPSSH